MVKMGLWLFHRKSHKRSRSGADLSDPDVNAGQSQASQQGQTSDVQSKPKRQRTNREPNKLRRRNRNLSYSPGRQDSIRVSSKRRRSREYSPQYRMPGTTSTVPYHEHRSYQQSTSPHRQRPQYPPQAHSQRQTIQPPSGPGSHHGSQEWYRIPTLRNKPPSGHMTRTKSSRRRRVDREREAEIRAMTANFEPVRPATEQWMSGRSIRKDSRRVRTGGFFSPSSDISLPSAASIRSSMSTDSEHAAFRVSAINSLAPRPTLRYLSMHPHAHHNPYGTYRYAADGTQDGSGPIRSTSQRKRLAERPPIPEATLRAHKRIDDLADDLTASDIRELMERDKRRRERKKQREQERMERRLARQAQKEQLQREQEVGEQLTGPNLERGVLGRELAGLGVTQPPSAVLTSSRPRTSAEEEERMDVDEEGTSHSNRESTSSSQPRPLEQFHRADSIPMEQNHDGHRAQERATEQHREMLPTTPRESEERVTEASDIIYEEEPSPAVAAAIAVASGFPQRKSSINRRKSDRRVLTKKSRSKSPPSTRETHDITSPVRHDDTSTTHKSSETGGSGRASRISWTAIFKWRGRNKRSSAGPSSFSNTSRDSMQAAHMTSAAAAASAVAASASSASAASSTPHPGSVPIAPNVTFIPPRRDGATHPPRRTVSRFREDLPETLISPPRPRIQSPASEVSSPHAPVAGENLEPEYHSGEPTPTRETYIMSHRDVDRATPTSMQTLQMSSVDPSPEPQSMSLASVDSEGSWFGGGFGARKQTRIASLNRYQQLEQAQQQGQERTVSPTSNTNNTEDELGLTEDEYLTRLSPAMGQPLRISTGTACPSSDGGHPEDGEATWGTLPRTPTVHHEAHKMKSSEVLLNTYGDLIEPDSDSEEDKEMKVDDMKEDSGIDTEPDSPERDEDALGVQRATSVNLGRSHVCHISAGSAKLLELTPRASVEARRRSFEPPGSITQ